MKMTPENKEPEFGLAQLGQVALRIHDVDSAIEFYRDALGMKFLFSTGTMAFFDCGGVRLMLSMPERPEFDRRGSILYFKVDDLKAARSTMIDRGGEFVDEPHLIARMPDHELWMSLDVVLQRPLGQHAGPHERSAGLTEDSAVRRCQHGLVPKAGQGAVGGRRCARAGHPAEPPATVPPQ